MSIDPKDTRIVLVRPRNPLNIAASARAMRNFGLDDLAIVAAYEPVWQDARAAPGAEELFQNARVAPRLLDVLEDRTLVLGTSSLARRRPALPVFDLGDLAELSKRRKTGERLSLLFGPEKTGLSNHDLSYCHGILRIPTADDCPSMNLGQAVAVCCYELRRAWRPKREQTAKKLAQATVGEVTRLVEEIEKMVAGNKKPTAQRESAGSFRLRQMFLRWPLTSEDVTLMMGVLRDLAWRIGKSSE